MYRTTKTLTILSLLTIHVIAYDVLYINFYTNQDCTGNQQSANLTDIRGCLDCSPFQSFQLNRSMLNTEQLDVSAGVDLEGNCNGFLESVWNWDTSCRNVNTSTCILFWTNIGPLNSIPGAGWGWNNSIWVNLTGDRNESLVMKVRADPEIEKV